jgi:hypothetical protein
VDQPAIAIPGRQEASDVSAPEPPIPRIFVSYAHADNDFCQPFVVHLRVALGLMDPDAIYHADFVEPVETVRAATRRSPCEFAARGLRRW